MSDRESVTRWVSATSGNRYYRHDGRVWRDMSFARALCETPMPDFEVTVSPETRLLAALAEGRRPIEAVAHPDIYP